MPSGVPGLPAIDECRFADEWPAHGDVVSGTFSDKALGNRIRANTAYEHEGHAHLLFEASRSLAVIDLLILRTRLAFTGR